ncbi:ATP-binding cassette domain-containing protein [Sinomicrobium sp.]
MIYCDQLALAYRGNAILDCISFRLPEGASLAIVGESGSGKTTLCRILAGKIQPSSGTYGGISSVEMVEQQDQFLAISGRGNTHYSQRYEAQDNSGMPEVYTYLKVVAKETGASEEVLEQAISQTQIGHILKRKLLQLSNGERKRTQLAAALLRAPKLLILDQPFVGLDAKSRAHIDSLLKELSKSMTLVIICGGEQVPDDIDKVLELEKGRLKQYVDRAHYTAVANKQVVLKDNSWFEQLRPYATSRKYDVVVGMEQVNVHLGGQHILKDIDWTVKSGERWALTGHNGAGKTTLLSLVTADNPQGYNNKLILFDRRRGTGESIWDIKKEIGFVSAELHLYFLRGKGILNTIPGINGRNRETYSSLSCLDVIVSGFKDEVGVVSKASEYQLNLAEQWLSVLGLERLKESNFAHASLGEQRCILLARALVKCPSLLILDEPLQGLDEQQIAYFKALLNRLCEALGTTMIFVSHYNGEIPECVNNKLTLDQGRVVECGVFNRGN